MKTTIQESIEVCKNVAEGGMFLSFTARENLRAAAERLEKLNELANEDIEDEENEGLAAIQRFQSKLKDLL